MGHFIVSVAEVLPFSPVAGDADVADFPFRFSIGDGDHGQSPMTMGRV